MLTEARDLASAYPSGSQEKTRAMTIAGDLLRLRSAPVIPAARLESIAADLKRLSDGQ